jgi:hypothetical protein
MSTTHDTDRVEITVREDETAEGGTTEIFDVLVDGSTVASFMDGEQAAECVQGWRARLKQERQITAVRDMLDAFTSNDTLAHAVEINLTFRPATIDRAQTLIDAANELGLNVVEGGSGYGTRWEVAGEDADGHPLVRERERYVYIQDFAVTVLFPKGERVRAGVEA